MPINWPMFAPRNFIIIGVFSVVALAIAGHVFKGVSPTNEGN